MKTKREYITDLLKQNPRKWMTAQEIALQCLGGRFTSSRDGVNLLMCDLQSARKNAGRRQGGILLASRYVNGGES